MKIEEMTLPVNNIISFSNVDGSGNRTSIFVQGCNLNCVYCHNSETIQMPCKKTTEINYTIGELLNIIKEYAPYIRGITVSGGEPTLYSNYLIRLFKEVKKLGLTCYIDTNGMFNRENIIGLIKETDKFLFDVKGINNLQNLIGRKLENNLDNLEYLLELNKVEEVRTVCIHHYMEVKKTVEEVARRLKKHDNVIYKLIRVHTRGLTKKQEESIKGYIPSDKEIMELENLARSIGVKNVISIL